MAHCKLDLADSASISRIRVGGLAISVCGVAELEASVLPWVTHVISIGDVHMANAEVPSRRVAKLCPAASPLYEFFDDVATQRRGAPSELAIRRILDFTSGLREGDNLLVHCNLGISRSTAIGYAVACQHSPPGHESACYQAVRQARPVASPNILIIRFADKILGRRGLMVRPFYTGQPGWTSLPERCSVCGDRINDDTVYFEASAGAATTVCEACFPSLGVCTGYGRCYLLPDGLRDWWLEG